MSIFYIENDKMKEKLKEAYDNGKKGVLNQKDDIIARAKDPEDCLKLMKDAIVKLVTDFTDQDEFLKDVPQSVIDDLEKDLKSEFEKEFVNLYFSLHFFFEKCKIHRFH